jgi:uncharacterized protein (TIGR00369 family)
MVESIPRLKFPVLATLEDGPFSSLLELRVEQASEGAVQVRLPFAPRLLNYGPSDVPIHGGAIATLVDFAACAAVWTLPATKRSATISMTVNYTAPGVQSDLVAKAVVRSQGKRIASIQVEVRNKSNLVVADALVTYKIS